MSTYKYWGDNPRVEIMAIDDVETTVSRRTTLRLSTASLATLVGFTGLASADTRGNENNRGQGSDEVTGQYKATWEIDSDGDTRWTNASGQGQVIEDEDFDEDDVVTTYYYVVTYRGYFGDTPHLNSGWIRNNVRAEGEVTGNWNTEFVHETDPRYHDGLESIWNDWGILVDTSRGQGNTANTPRPQQ